MQRRDRKGGGESSCDSPRGAKFPLVPTVAPEVKVAASSSLTVVFDTSVFDSGNGACEAEQQDAVGAVRLGAVCSPMSILSQWD